MLQKKVRSHAPADEQTASYGGQYDGSALVQPLTSTTCRRCLPYRPNIPDHLTGQIIYPSLQLCVVHICSNPCSHTLGLRTIFAEQNLRYETRYSRPDYHRPLFYAKKQQNKNMHTGIYRCYKELYALYGSWLLGSRSKLSLLAKHY